MYDKYIEQAVFLDNLNDCPKSMHHAEEIGMFSLKEWIEKSVDESFCLEHHLSLHNALDIMHMYQQSVILVRFAQNNMLNINNLKNMLYHKAYIDFQNEQGDTALMISVKKEKLSLVKSLIDYGANPYINNRQGITPQFISHGKSTKLLMNAVAYQADECTFVKYSTC